MALPMTPPSRWIRDLNRPFSMFEQAFDTMDDYQLYEEEDHFVLTIDVPGYRREEITITWDEGVLNIAAEHVDEDRGRERTYHRRFRFPKSIDEESIEASYNNGVLEVTLPLASDSIVHGRVIPINE